MCRALGDAENIDAGVYLLANDHHVNSRFCEAEARFQECIERFEEAGNQRSVLSCLSSLRESAGGRPVPPACYPVDIGQETITLTREELVGLVADAVRALR